MKIKNPTLYMSFLLTFGISCFAKDITYSPNENKDIISITQLSKSFDEMCTHQGAIYSSYKDAFSLAYNSQITPLSFIAFDTALGVVSNCKNSTLLWDLDSVCTLRASNLTRLIEKETEQSSKDFLEAQKSAVIRLCGD